MIEKGEERFGASRVSFLAILRQNALRFGHATRSSLALATEVHGLLSSTSPSPAAYQDHHLTIPALLRFYIASSMKRFWQITALILLALMVPASMCCWVPESSCKSCESQAGPAHHEDGGETQNTCPSDTIAHSQLPVAIMMPEMQMLVLLDLLAAMVHRNESSTAFSGSTSEMTAAPPELSPTWAFVSRAALPARAPSALA